MEFSCSRMRSNSASVKARRVRRATCSTSLRSIIASHLLEMRVLDREPLAADAREPDRDDVVGPVALDPDHQALAEARVAHPGPDAEGQILADRFGGRSVGSGILGPSGRRLPPRIQRDELALRHLAQEPRGLTDAVAMDAAMERVREIEPLSGPRDADVAETALLLDLVL